jgi:hypothetical protein
MFGKKKKIMFPLYENCDFHGDEDFDWTSGLWHRGVWYVVTTVSEKLTVSIFRPDNGDNMFL